MSCVLTSISVCNVHAQVTAVLLFKTRQFWGKHLTDKRNTPINCELDRSMQRHTIEADA